MNWLKGFLRGSPSAKQLASVVQAERSQWVTVEGVEPFDITAHFNDHQGMPIPDWNAIGQWVDSQLASNQDAAWSGSIHAWLLHMRDALGEPNAFIQSKRALLVAPFEVRTSTAMARHMERTLKSVSEILPDVALAEADWRPILIVFQDQHRYYDYISHAYPDHGEYGFSGGMYLRIGPGHFVTYLDELHRMERVIAHEMTHACLSHLEIPLWLNEGLAVNTEHRIVGRLPPEFGPQEMHGKHVEFWNSKTIQEFWSGQAFQRSDEGMMLAYDLASILVRNMSADWKAFAAFASAASYKDGGARAARQHLHLDLGRSVAAMFDGESPNEWAPKTGSWDVAAKPD